MSGGALSPRVPDYGARFLPALDDAATRLYVTPLDLVDGAAAQAVVAAGAALPLTGGPLAFSRVLLAWRRSDEAPRRCIVSLDEVRGWGEGLIAPLRQSLFETLDRLAAPRPPFAGLSLERPRVMGVVNVTPDSFSDGGRYFDREVAVAQGRSLAKMGADIVDIGGESTRPGAEPVPLAVELDRVLPVIAGLRDLPVLLSIDSRNATVMREALAAGAHIVNDITALSDAASVAAVAESGAPTILMHSQGDPRIMQRDPHYADVVCDVYDYLAERIAACEAAGIRRERLLVDPGIGFGKTVAHNIELLRGIAGFHGLGVGLLVGVSHKSFIARLSAGEPPDRRVPGSIAAALAAVRAGAQMVRAHEVAETRQALAVFSALTLAGPLRVDDGKP